LGVVKAHGKNPYTLVSPYLNRVSVHLASHSLDVLNEGVQFVGVSAANFFETTLSFTLPTLVLNLRKDALDMVSRITGRHLGLLLMESLHDVLALLFMQDSQEAFVRSTSFLVELFSNIAKDPSRVERQPFGKGFTLGSLVTSCIVTFLVEIIVNWGDPRVLVVRQAEVAIRRAQAAIQSASAGYAQQDLGAFLKNHMLGIISGMNEILLDIQGRKTVEEKQKVIRSMGGLIKRVGSVIAAFSPQVSCVCLFSPITANLHTFRSWPVFKARSQSRPSGLRRFTHGASSLNHHASSMLALMWVRLSPHSCAFGRK
jgi:serine/threonine-protein kinase ATR